MTPDSTAEAVNHSLTEGDEDFALRLVLQARDDLRSGTLEPSEIRAIWSHRSRRIAEDRFDTLLRAVVAHELAENAPAWALDAALDSDWVLPDPFRDETRIRAMTPDWLARSRIYIAERGLVTA